MIDIPLLNLAPPRETVPLGKRAMLVRTDWTRRSGIRVRGYVGRSAWSFPTIQWFLEIAAAGQLDLEPPYQRRSVWSEDYRRFYIDSILRDFPSPAIYLQVETVAGAPTMASSGFWP